MNNMHAMKMISAFCAYFFKPDIGTGLRRRRFLYGGLLSLGALLLQLLAGSPAQAHGNRVRAGDILVLDYHGGTDGGPALLVVNPKTGGRAVLSDFGNPAQGPSGQDILNVAVGSRGQIFVSDLFIQGSSEGGALYGVDPGTGNRTLISNFAEGDIKGPLYRGLAVDAKGRVIAGLDRSQPPAYETNFAVVRIRPETDRRVLVSDLKNPAQGQVLSAVITDLTLESKGTILIGTTADSDAIFRVNPVTGRRKLVSDFANPAQGVDVGGLQFSTGLATEASGTILAASGGSIYAPRNLLFRIHPRTGQRTVLSDFDDPGQGVVGSQLSGVAVETSGKIIVAAHDPLIGDEASLLFRVDPKTGQRVLFSDPANPVLGPSFGNITYIAIVPHRDPGGHDTDDNAEDDD